jgi:hypothetical protein
VTQFDRALLALNIEIICANSPQAKGPDLAEHIAANDGSCGRKWRNGLLAENRARVIFGPRCVGRRRVEADLNLTRDIVSGHVTFSR